MDKNKKLPKNISELILRPCVGQRQSRVTIPKSWGDDFLFIKRIPKEELKKFRLMSGIK